MSRGPWRFGKVRLPLKLLFSNPPTLEQPSTAAHPKFIAIAYTTAYFPAVASVLLHAHRETTQRPGLATRLPRSRLRRSHSRSEAKCLSDLLERSCQPRYHIYSG